MTWDFLKMLEKRAKEGRKEVGERTKEKKQKIKLIKYGVIKINKILKIKVQ